MMSSMKGTHSQKITVSPMVFGKRSVLMRNSSARVNSNTFATPRSVCCHPRPKFVTQCNRGVVNHFNDGSQYSHVLLCCDEHGTRSTPQHPSSDCTNSMFSIFCHSFNFLSANPRTSQKSFHCCFMLPVFVKVTLSFRSTSTTSTCTPRFWDFARQPVEV